MLGVVFRKAQNRIQDPAKLQRLIHDLIDGETWMTLDVDVKGDAYEGLLEKNAADTKSGAGQYFTPRALIAAMVDVMQPTPDMRICDPACGTGGFFLAAVRLHRRTTRTSTVTRSAPALGCFHGVGDRRQHCPPVCHEPAAARHRDAGE
jgi:type I restriction enzyme M protein